jgi:hypothetical protein
MNAMTNRELHDVIEEGCGGAVAREVLRRLEAPTPINVEQEAELDRLRRELGR